MKFWSSLSFHPVALWLVFVRVKTSKTLIAGPLLQAVPAAPTLNPQPQTWQPPFNAPLFWVLSVSWGRVRPDPLGERASIPSPGLNFRRVSGVQIGIPRPQRPAGDLDPPPPHICEAGLRTDGNQGCHPNSVGGGWVLTTESLTCV